jgi:Kef-type K+ transport system membrane component KefB
VGTLIGEFEDMKKAAITYVAMFAVCGIGLWIILVQGGRLQAPPDVSGTWSLSAEDQPDQAPLLSMRIEQSGRFVRIAFDPGPFQDYRLETGEDASGREVVRLTGSSDELVLSSEKGSGETRRAERRSVGSQVESVRYVATRMSRSTEKRVEPMPTAGDDSGGPEHPILLLITQLVVIILASRVMGWLVTLIGQPRVVGEMIAGLMLGPSLLGWLLPDIAGTLFPASSIPTLGLLAQLGVIFFLFVIGLELNPQLLRHRGHIAVVISHASIIAPFLLGGALSLYLYDQVFNDAPSMRFSSVALFMGAAMSITAFPVLARILTERNLHKTRIGAIAITCAAVDDVSAWCLLAFVIGLARAEGMGQAITTTLLAAVFVTAMLFVVRPLLRRVEAYYDRSGQLTTGVLSVLLLVVLGSSLATEAIGIHALFGAFLAGAIMPKGGRFVRDVTRRVEQFTLIVLLPIFFVFTGLKTRIELINSPELWMLTLLIIAVACAGKFGGSTLAAAACGMKWRESSAIGILMNTRGLMELVILSIGRELGVITDAVFAMMVLMALVTTVLTTPVLAWVYPSGLTRERPQPAASGRGHDSVLIPVSLPRSARALIQLADVITGPANPGRTVVGLHLRRAEEYEAYRSAAGQPAEPTEPLLALQASADEIGMDIEPISFVSRDPASAISRIALDHGVSLVLMGFHKPILGTTILGGTVHRVFEQVTADVAVFVDRGLPGRPASILVPYLGSDDDRLALDLASTIARHAGAAITVLHVIPPSGTPEGQNRAPLHVKEHTDRVFTDSTQPFPVTFQVVESSEPIATVLEQCRPFDLVLIGVSERWGLTSQLFGWRAERIARDCPTSMLIVRRGSQRPPDSERASGAEHLGSE